MRAVALAGALVAVVAGAAWAPVLGGDFFWDDRANIVDNAWLQAPLERFVAAAMQPHHGHWHPATWWSLRLDTALWGPWLTDLGPAAPHLASNLVLHVACTLALAALVWLALAVALPPTLGAPTRALLAAGAAAAWALHPARVESVAWVTERRDGLSTLAILLGMTAWLWARWRDERGQGSRAAWMVAAACLTASALGKAWVVALPAALWALDIGVFAASRTAAGLRRATARAAAWLALALPVALTAAWAQRAAGAAAEVAALPLLERLRTALALPWWYLGMTLGIVPPSPLHPRPPGWADDPVVAAAAALTLVSLLALWRWRARRPLLLGTTVGFVAWLAPVLGLLQSGVQLVAERYLVLAHVPLVLGAALGVGRALAMGRGRGAAAGVALATVALLALEAAAMRRWQQTWLLGEEALWSAALEVEPYGPHALVNRAAARLERGEVAGARADAEGAIAQLPQLSEGWRLKAEALRRGGDGAGAQAALDHAIALAPDDGGLRCNRGALRAERADLAGARADVDAAIAAGAGPACRLNRAVLAFRRGDRAAAASDIAEALRELPPAHPLAARARGMADAVRRAAAP